MSLTVEDFRLSFADGLEPESDEPEMESTLHYEQLALLVSLLEWHWRARDDYFIGANLSVYFRKDQFTRRELRGPDFFLVRGVEQRPRRSWTVWLEGGRYPDLIIELLSDATARVDRTIKKTLYQDVFRTPEYYWFSPDTGELAGFHLLDRLYQPIPADPQGLLASPILGLRLGVHEGLLRFFDESGAPIPTLPEVIDQEQALVRQQQALVRQEQERAEQERERAEQEQARAEQEQARAEQEQARAEQERERAEQEQARAEQERERANQERLRADRLADRLRALGIDPELN